MDSGARRRSSAMTACTAPRNPPVREGGREGWRWACGLRPSRSPPSSSSVESESAVGAEGCGAAGRGGREGGARAGCSSAGRASTSTARGIERQNILWMRGKRGEAEIGASRSRGSSYSRTVRRVRTGGAREVRARTGAVADPPRVVPCLALLVRLGGVRARPATVYIRQSERELKTGRTERERDDSHGLQRDLAFAPGYPGASRTSRKRKDKGSRRATGEAGEVAARSFRRGRATTALRGPCPRGVHSQP